ncbi:MAG TPA: 30S ribosomal protein S11 [Candidatus Paceibacterota bacterium]|nr:30S ribosomal protein S11 [Candidatus Paceibacterota bacterium]HMP18754.1 30S ribosomal protein S11 [Candidatus Paceibacterota bacterium]HMP85315.1 30S ribosomal protein S11 [Candidatus Paceibacterota bacterium]
MGKKRIVKKTENSDDSSSKSSASAKRLSKKRIEAGILYVRSTYNNTTLLLTDLKGNAIGASSSGALGFKGAKKGTPFAASKAAEVLAEKAEQVGMKKVDVIIKGVGSGRESSVRSFISKGIQLNSLKDMTPVPHNGPKPPKPRRV